MKGEENPHLKKKKFSSAGKIWQFLLLALGLLTTIPINHKRGLQFDDKDIAGATVLFPVIGFIIGMILFSIYLILTPFFSFQITSGIILTGWICITGALHLDGLMDTVDGINGGKNKEEILNIMEDTHTGAKGVVAVTLLLIIKFVLILHLVSSAKLSNLIYAPITSRWGIVLGCSLIPYARDKGMGKFGSFVRYPHILGATIIALIPGIILLGSFSFILLSGIGILSFLWSLYLRKKIGGFTGDTLGALNEMGEVLALLIGCASLS